MARANVRSTIVDESAVIPAQEGPSSFVLGIIDDEFFPENILGAIGFTHERETGVVKISSVGEFRERLRSTDPTGFFDEGSGLNIEPFLHFESGSIVSGNKYAGLTFERWPDGVLSDFRWAYIWGYIENYLQYGGRVTIYSAKSGESLSEVISRAKDKKEPIDAFASIFFTRNNDVRSVVNYRQDCIAITAVPSEHKAGDLSKRFPQITPSDLTFLADNQGLAGATFYDGATFTYDGYTDPIAGQARQMFQRTFVVNKGDTYSYPPARPVYSVRYFDQRPIQTLLGTTTDVINYIRMTEVSPSEEAFGVRGLTYDLEHPAFIGVGATFGLTFAEAPPNGGLRFGNDGIRDGSRNISSQLKISDDLTFTDYINYTDHVSSSGAVTYFENSYESASVGDIVVRNKLQNLYDDSFMDSFIGAGPLSTPYTPPAGLTMTAGAEFDGEIQGFIGYANFRSVMTPSNWMDPFSYSIGTIRNDNDGAFPDADGIGFIYPTRQAVSYEQFDGKITATLELSGVGSGVITESTNSVSLAELHLIDMKQSLNPDFDLLDNLYGPSGTIPNTEIYNRCKNYRTGSVGGRILGSTANYEKQSKFFKQTFNIFGPTGPTSGTDINGNSPIDFWGCTCSRIPEFMSTFNFVGLTPDICIEVGPNSRTQDVTADGSTYTAYIGWSEPYPRVTINNGVNIFGERIGFTDPSAALDAGSTADIFIRQKIENTTPQIESFLNPTTGLNDQILCNSLVFYPLVEDLSESDFGLTADKENYFGVTHVIPSSSSPNLKALKSLQHKKRNDSQLDPSYQYFEHIFTDAGFSITQYGSENRQLPVSVNLNELYNAEDGQSISNPVGGTYPNMVWTKGTPGITAISQFYGTSGVSLNGRNNEGIYLIAEIDFKPGDDRIVSLDLDEVVFDQQDVSYNNIFSSNADLYEFPVFGEKYAEDSYEAYKSVEETQDINRANEIPFTSDVAGMFARLFRDLSPWFSPANQRVSDVTDIIAERYHLSNTEQDDLYDNKINFIKQIDGALKLWGDKTFANSTSTFSRVNVANLFIYLKKKIEPLGRRFLFEQNDAQSRELFRNAVEPFLQTLRGQRAITDFKVICDDTNNTPDIVDSNQFVAEILIKPTKTINYIRLTMTNVGTSFELE